MEKAIINYKLHRSNSIETERFDDVDDAIKRFKELNKDPQVLNPSIIY